MNQQILFNDSNLYLQDTSSLQGSINFINPLDIDIYVKTSFLSMSDLVTISGGYIQSFNKDHIISDTFNYYNIKSNNNQALVNSIGPVIFDLENSGFFSGSIIKSIIQNIPFITIIFIIIISFLLPTSIANFFRYISLLGILITLIFYFSKLIKTAIKISQSQGIDYNGINIKYQNSADILNITPGYTQLLKTLRTQMQIQKIILSDGQFHLKQKIKKSDTIDYIKSLFTSTQPINEQENLQRIQNTIFYLSNNGLIGTSSTR